MASQKKSNFTIVYKAKLNGVDETQNIAQIIARDPVEACQKLAEMWKGFDVTVLQVSEPQEFTYDWTTDDKLGKVINEKPFSIEDVANASAENVAKLFGKNVSNVVDLDAWAEKNGRKTKSDVWKDAHTSGKEKTANW